MHYGIVPVFQKCLFFTDLSGVQQSRLESTGTLKVGEVLAKYLNICVQASHYSWSVHTPPLVYRTYYLC